MDLGPGAYGRGFVAGLLSTLSPCVLPLVPILLGAAAHPHRLAPLALGVGLAVSYMLIGTGLAASGSLLGLDAAALRLGGAALLAGLGLILVSQRLQRGFAQSMAGISRAGHQVMTGLRTDGMAGPLAIGLVLGLVWSPCVGPTLGAAIVLASQGNALPQVALLMGLFGLGAALPVVALAYGARSGTSHLRQRLLRAGQTGKVILGMLLLLVAALVLSGWDQAIEAWLTDQSPEWLLRLTTRY
jgi:cytochrome c biogenesis protein CcdA